MGNTTTLEDLLSFFPEVELPITFSEELAHVADAENKVLHKDIIEEWILPWEGNDIDEYTEFVPVLRIAEAEEFYAIVYWKGGLMKYEFVLVTVDKRGVFITRKPLATTILDGQVVKKSISKIDEDMIIHIMAGENVGDEVYDPTRSQAFNMEILHTGDVIFSLDD